MATSRVPRLFLDTNVVFSGLRSTKSPPGEILKLHLDRRLQAIVSRQIVTELVRNLLKKSPESILNLQAFIASRSLEVIENPAAEDVAAAVSAGVNFDDAPILAAALSSGCDYLISGDRSFIDECARATTALSPLSPRDFLKEISGSQ